MKWDLIAMLAGLVIIGLWAIMNIQAKRRQEVELRRRRSAASREERWGLRRPRRRRWGETDRG